MPLVKTPGIVLKSRRWGEADRIVTFYTARLGKIRGVARGARRMKSRFCGALEPFVHSDLNLFEKQGDSLFRLNHIDVREAFPAVREDLTRIAAAASLVNLVSAVTREGDPDPEIYDTLLTGLRTVHETADARLAALLFQIKLVCETGYRPQTEHCAQCGRDQNLTEGHFSPRAGGLVCDPCNRCYPGSCLMLSAGTWAALRQASRMHPTVLTRLKVTGPIRKQLEMAMEGFVRAIAGMRLPPTEFMAAEPSAPVYGSSR